MNATSFDFDEFCKAVSPRLIGALVLQVGDRGRAEDVAQEALARAWARWPEVAVMERRDSWVYTVAYRLVIGGHRRDEVERRANRRSVAGSESSGDETEMRTVDRLVLAEALHAMTSRQRAVITLRFYAGFGVADTAEIMRCAEGTVKALTSQALARLRSTLEGDEAPSAPTTSGGDTR